MRYVKMQREGEIADVADIEVEIWQAAGFEVMSAEEQTVSETETQAETETEAPVKRRGRPRKAD
jgi:hypothetical protein